MKNIIYTFFFTYAYAGSSGFGDLHQDMQRAMLVQKMELITAKIKLEDAKSKKKKLENSDIELLNQNIFILTREMNSLKKELLKLKNKQDTMGRLSTSEDGAIMTFESN